MPYNSYGKSLPGEAAAIFACVGSGVIIGLMCAFLISRIVMEGAGSNIANSAVKQGYAEWSLQDQENRESPEKCLRVIQDFPGKDFVFEKSSRKAGGIIQCN